MATAAAAVEQSKSRDEAPKHTPVFEDDDMVTCLRRNWGDVEKCPPNKTDYLDGYTCVGGVIRNVPYATARKWAKLGFIAKEHIFPNDATPEQFVEATGRSPIDPRNLAEALTQLSPEKIAAILGHEGALKLAKEVQQLVSSRGGNKQQEGA